MKPTVAAVALATALAVAGCGGGGAGRPVAGRARTIGHAEHGTVLYGALPAVGTPRDGGTISFAQQTDESPTEVLPILDDANTSTADFELNAAMYLPLFNGPRGAVPTVDYADSLATGPPRFSDGDRTVTIDLRAGLRWSDGAPVDAYDVLFSIAMLKAAVTESPANWSQYISGEFPSSVTSDSAPNPHTVVLHLDRPYNPGYFLLDQLEDTGGGLFALPSTDWNVARAGGPHLADWRDPRVAKAIYDHLHKAGTAVASFATDPLFSDVDGPFSLRSFSATNGSFTLVPNPHYGLEPRPRFDRLSVQTYTSPQSALDALRVGQVDVVQLDPSQLPQASSLRRSGVSVFGGPSFGWAGAFLNFEDRTDDFNHVVAQRYVREALQHLVDQPAYLPGLYRDAAVVGYGPVPSAPSSPYAPADVATPPYPYSPAAAVALLRAHGWRVRPGATTTCVKPGAGASRCGAGIPAGTPIRFTWDSAPATQSSAELLAAEAVASVARQDAGIDITVHQASSANLEQDNDADPSAAKDRGTWGAVTTDTVALIDYYPTQAGFDIPTGEDVGGYVDPTATRLIDASVHGGDLDAVERESSYLARDLPDLYLPNPDVLFAVAKGVGGPADSWTALTEGAAFFPQYWYRTR